MFPFSKLHSLHHICFDFDGHFLLALLCALLHHALWVRLTPVPSSIPGGHYFIWPTTRPQVGIAVLVRALDWVKAAWDRVLQGPAEWGSQGRNVTMQQTKLGLTRSWNKTTEKKEKQRKDMAGILTEHICYFLCLNTTNSYFLLSCLVIHPFFLLSLYHSVSLPVVSLLLSLSCCSCPFPLSSETLPANECHKALGPNTIRRPSQAHPTHQPPPPLLHTHTRRKPRTFSQHVPD